MKLKFLPIIMFAASANFYGQVTPPEQDNSVYAKSQSGSYILKGIVIDGVQKYSADQVLRFTGLVKGETIEIPGQKIGNAIKKLWETGNFSEVEVYVQSIEGSEITLSFHLQDLKELGEIKVTGKGVSKSKSEKIIKDNDLKPGTKITNNLISTLNRKIPQDYINKGFADAKISIQDSINAKDANQEDWNIIVNKGKKVKIDDITFEGNEEVKDSKLRKKGFKDTKQKGFEIMRPFKASKFIQDKYDEDKVNLINYYNSLGFRDATIVSDKVSRNQKNNYDIDILLSEGKKYYIGDITFLGNTTFSTEYLEKVLGYQTETSTMQLGLTKR